MKMCHKLQFLQLPLEAAPEVSQVATLGLGENEDSCNTLTSSHCQTV